MKWELVRPGVVRLVYDNGAFLAEYDYDNRTMLGVNRRGTATFDLEHIERKARTMVAKGITSAKVGDD